MRNPVKAMKKVRHLKEKNVVLVLSQIKKAKLSNHLGGKIF
jgi:hypothetical protein